MWPKENISFFTFNCIEEVVKFRSFVKETFRKEDVDLQFTVLTDGELLTIEEIDYIDYCINVDEISATTQDSLDLISNKEFLLKLYHKLKTYGFSML